MNVKLAAVALFLSLSVVASTAGATGSGCRCDKKMDPIRCDIRNIIRCVVDLEDEQRKDRERAATPRLP